MSRTRARLLPVLAAAASALLLVPAQAGDDVTVSLCDGSSVMTVPGLKAGQALPPERAREVAKLMMVSWRGTAGEARWSDWEREASAQAQAAPAVDAPKQPTKFTARDQMLWQREEKKWIEEGYKAYHDAKALGGTIGISCDMCHPDGSNTHAETYPKFQTQLKKVALLRDMINWCIENPLKGKPLPENDPALRAVEAYILSTRKGVALQAGKH